MKFEATSIFKIGILSCLAMGLLLLGAGGVLAQEEKAPQTLVTPELPAGMKDPAKTVLKVDVLFLLDNSGSMKANDPQFVTREIVTKFMMNLKKEFRVGMVTFDQEAELIESLTSVDTVADREKFIKSLDRIDYKGQFTNTPSGVERAIYELKSNGREDAEKIIILLTDGIVDTGEQGARHRWRSVVERAADHGLQESRYSRIWCCFHRFG